MQLPSETSRALRAFWRLIYPLLFILFFHGWHILYFYTLQPHLLARLEAATASASPIPDLLLGGGLVIFQVMEVIGLWLKAPAIHHRVRRGGDVPEGGYIVVMLVSLAHMGLAALLTFAIFDLLGIDLSGAPTVSGMFGFLLFVAMLVKEGLLMTLVMDLRKPALSLPVSPLNRSFPRASAILADGMLALFGAVAYTVTWERLAATSPFTAATLRGQLLEYVGAMALFGLIYPATHPLVVVETWLLRRGWPARIFAGISFLVAMFAALTSIPAGR